MDDAASSQYSSDGGIGELDHFYMLFETCSANLYQMITVRKQKFFKAQQKAGKVSEIKSETTFANIVRLEADSMNMFSENDLLRLIVRLIDLFARL